MKKILYVRHPGKSISTKIEFNKTIVTTRRNISIPDRLDSNEKIYSRYAAAIKLLSAVQGEEMALTDILVFFLNPRQTLSAFKGNEGD